jgi:hypothetical protein
MRDELDSRIWAENHSQFSADLARALEAIRITFCKLARIQFSAPWKPEPQDGC